MDDLTVSQIVKHTRVDNGKTFGIFNAHYLSTSLQPVFSIAHKSVVGYEALVRSEYSVNLADLFSPKQGESSFILLDRLCRYIHVRNFLTLNDPLNWLFLNISPIAILRGKYYGSFFAEMLRKSEIDPYRVVIEIVENPIADQNLLLETVNYYRKMGCLIALDDFGAGYSNFERIWVLDPDIVKLDRSMIVRASEQKKIRDLLPGIVSLLHQAGCLVVTEGIETEEQAMIAMECDADFVQGYFFAHPETDFHKFENLDMPFDSLFEKCKSASAAEESELRMLYERYTGLYQQAITRISSAENLQEACRELMTDEKTVRCYLLLPNGIQIGHTVVSEAYRNKADIRFKPLHDTRNADWFRRHYLRRAMMHPNQLQITRPYLSITGAHLCVTLSMMFSTPSGSFVFCCDLNWE
jgi:EAL domain-containing protein (putative c-di-GMP-specific phosphodiesterase class I)